MPFLAIEFTMDDPHKSLPSQISLRECLSEPTEAVTPEPRQMRDTLVSFFNENGEVRKSSSPRAFATELSTGSVEVVSATIPRCADYEYRRALWALVARLVDDIVPGISGTRTSGGNSSWSSVLGPRRLTDNTDGILNEVSPSCSANSAPATSNGTQEREGYWTNAKLAPWLDNHLQLNEVLMRMYGAGGGDERDINARYSWKEARIEKACEWKQSEIQWGRRSGDQELAELKVKFRERTDKLIRMTALEGIIKRQEESESEKGGAQAYFAEPADDLYLYFLSAQPPSRYRGELLLLCSDLTKLLRVQCQLLEQKMFLVKQDYEMKLEEVRQEREESLEVAKNEYKREMEAFEKATKAGSRGENLPAHTLPPADRYTFGMLEVFPPAQAEEEQAEEKQAEEKQAEEKQAEEYQAEENQAEEKQAEEMQVERTGQERNQHHTRDSSTQHTAAKTAPPNTPQTTEETTGWTKAHDERLCTTTDMSTRQTEHDGQEHTEDRSTQQTTARERDRQQHTLDNEAWEKLEWSSSGVSSAGQQSPTSDEAWERVSAGQQSPTSDSPDSWEMV